MGVSGGDIYKENKTKFTSLSALSSYHIDAIRVAAGSPLARWRLEQGSTLHNFLLATERNTAT